MKLVNIASFFMEINMKNHIISIIGHKYGEYTVLKRLPYPNKCNYHICKCSCGNIVKVQRTHLKNGSAIQCPKCRVNKKLNIPVYHVSNIKSGSWSNVII